ncbi:MAG: IS110 family transposase [Pseudomonadales bacterium]|nr:IS110 family transposase [Pseudomonadales bacterium]
MVAEIGVDMQRFPSAGHLVSWAGLCPKNDESAGKRRSTRIRQGAPWLKTTLVTSAWGAVRQKDSYLQVRISRHVGRGFHVMPGQHFTACRASISRHAGPPGGWIG